MSKDKPEPYKLEQHNFSGQLRGVGKKHCVKCGLFALNNRFTEWAVRMGCNHKDHPSYENKKFELTRLM